MHKETGGPEGTARTDQLIWDAQAGSIEALGRLLEGCRAYLLLIANEDLDADLRPKGGASDLVQQTFIEAQQDFAQFQGRSQRELRNWLHGILCHNLADFRRRYRDRAARQVGREEPLRGVARRALRDRLTTDSPPPEDKAAAAEEAEAVRAATARLPEDYRRVIALRHEEGQSFDDIARHMGRKPEAVRKLWFRAVARLRQEIGIPPDRGY
jgi:RNA polymerase sigma-70 factor (ECF subfamily)